MHEPLKIILDLIYCLFLYEYFLNKVNWPIYDINPKKNEYH